MSVLRAAIIYTIFLRLEFLRVCYLLLFLLLANAAVVYTFSNYLLLVFYYII